MRTFTMFGLCALLALGGCTSDEPTGPGPLPEIVMPPSADGLMMDFERAYALMDPAVYEALLDEDFEYKFLDAARDAEPWTREQELASTGNMFAGNAADYFDGQLVCTGVESITIEELIRLTPWDDVGANDPDFPNTERAMFQVIIRFHSDGGENSLTVASRQIFYVSHIEVEQDDMTVTEYRLAGQRDLYPHKGNVDLHWGDIKRMFLPE